MAVYFAGSEPEIFDTFGGSVTTDPSVTIAGQNRAGVVFVGPSQTGTASFTPLTEGWIHFIFGRSGSNSSAFGEDTMFRLRNAESVDIFRIATVPFNTTYTLLYLLSQPAVVVTPGTYDIQFKIAASGGFFRVWINGVNVINFSGNTQFSSGTQSVSRMAFAGPDFSVQFSAFFSQFLVSDQPTLGCKVYTRALSTGAINQWTGTLSNITGTGFAGTTNALSETTANEAFLCVTEDLPTLGVGEVLTGVVGSIRALTEVGSPVTKIAFAAYDGATTTEFPTQVTPTASFGSFDFLANTNFENSNIAWNVTDFNALQFGFVAKA